jgi:hypothetical protein
VTMTEPGRSRRVALPRPQRGGLAYEVSRLRAQGPSLARPCQGAFMRHRRPEPISEFVSFLVREGRVETVMIEHVPASSGHCRRCSKPWPCYWRKVAAAALPLACKPDQLRPGRE